MPDTHLLVKVRARRFLIRSAHLLGFAAVCEGLDVAALLLHWPGPTAIVSFP